MRGEKGCERAAAECCMLSAYLLVVHKPARVDPPLIPIKRARMYREALPPLMQLQPSTLVRSERPSAIAIICARIRRFDNVREEPRAQDGLQQLGVVRVAVRAFSRFNPSSSNFELAASTSLHLLDQSWPVGRGPSIAFSCCSRNSAQRSRPSRCANFT